MSKRGKRRNSRRRKSSSSSKQSVSPNFFQKQNKSNSVGYNDDQVEKGEADSLRKENVLSTFDKEKRLEQEHHTDPFPSKMTIYTKTTEDGDSGITIVASVSIGDLEDSCPQITCDPSPTPLTKVMEVECRGSNVRVEIQEILHMNSADIKTTVVVVQDKGAEMFLGDKHEKTWKPNKQFFEQPLHKVSSEGSSPSYRFSCGSVSECTKADSPANSCCCCCCRGHKKQIPVHLLSTGPTWSPPVLFNIQPHMKRNISEDNSSPDQCWDIPPPQEFADKPQGLKGLARDLASCEISLANKQQGEFPWKHYRSCKEEPADAAEGARRARVAPSFDQLSESDNYEPVFLRGSLSTNRSSFTKNFINGQKRKSWIRNNSIATVEHRVCPFPKKRRQTFPGTSKEGGLMHEGLLVSCGESFSSLFMCSLHLSAEKPGTRTGNNKCFQTRRSSNPSSETPGSQLLSPLYVTSSEDNIGDAFAGRQQYGNTSITYNPTDLRQGKVDLKSSASKAVEGLDACVYAADHGELADRGCDLELNRVDRPSPEPISIQVIPPSCSGSEEQMLQSHPVTSFHHNRLENATNQDRVSGAPTCRTVGEQRPTAMESPETHVTASGVHPHHTKADAETTGSSHPSASVTTQQEGHSENPDKTAAALCVSGKASTDAEQPRQAVVSSSFSEVRGHLRPVIEKEADSSGSDRWAKRRQLLKETKQWSSAGGSSVTSDITEESVSEDTRSPNMTLEDRSFYTDTFHSSAWIYQGDDVGEGAVPPGLDARTRVASIRERTVSISKGPGEYPWGFRIQFSKPIVVTEVDTNGAAEEAGLMVGDFVLAVNGTDVTSIPHSEAAALARQGPDVLTLTIGSDIARCPNSPWPACRGYLHKRTQSGLIKGWRKRWFVLTHDCCLCYYRHRRDEGRRRPLSAVKLEGAEVGQDNSLGKPFVFKCRPLSATRVYFFCATSSQEMKRWLEAMEKALHPVTQKHVWVDVTRHNSNMPPLAVKSPECLGLLHKLDRSRDTWLQFYCVLKDACLYLYSGIRATHAHSGIYLQGYTVREQPNGSKKSTIELKPPSEEFKTFYVCAENPSENKRWIVAIRASVKRWLPLHQALQDCRARPPEETRM